MKQLIDSSGDMHTYAELTPLSNPQHTGWMRLRVTTVYDAAKDPANERIRFDMCLPPDSYEKFKNLFNN